MSSGRILLLRRLPLKAARFLMFCFVLTRSFMATVYYLGLLIEVHY